MNKAAEHEENCGTINDVIQAFPFDGDFVSCTRFGNGHINDTFLASYRKNEKIRRYTVQRINTDVFKNPDELMENLYRVTSFLADKITRNGGDASRETINIMKDKTGQTFFRDKTGSCWRAYPFVEDAHSFDTVRTPEDLYNAALAFGRFQNMLSDFPAASLYETIPHFHDTPYRYEAFAESVQRDVCGRATGVQHEIDFFLERKRGISLFIDAHKQGRIPLRVTHNDTKLNNVLLDDKTGKGLCVIDLDTVMPGFAGFDFGDLIRFGASTAAEDETDLSKVSLDMMLFKVCAEGFLEGCGGSLTESEINTLPDGARIMTMESGLRFLTDYLNGDTYFKIHREGQNLDRCRTQIELVRSFEAQQKQLDQCIAAI